MGSDIYLCVEKRTGDGWEMVLSSLDIADANFAIDRRNYQLFALLASVRGESVLGHKPRGLPNDVSEWAATWYRDNSFHSKSWLPMDEFIEVVKYYDTQQHDPERRLLTGVRPPLTELFGLDDDGQQYRVIFGFDC